MIYMSVNTHDYENDVRVMIQAFYPGQKIITDRERAAACMLRTDVAVTGSQIRARITQAAGGGTDRGAGTSDDGADCGTGTSDDGTDCGTGGGVIDCDAKTDDRKAIRNRLKRELYAVYAGLTGKELLWGTLTGIRPTKIPYAMLENGIGDEEILRTLKSEYLMSDAKAELSLSVARREYALLSELESEESPPWRSASRRNVSESPPRREASRRNVNESPPRRSAFRRNVEDGYSLYVGIPFCPSTCLYCSFTSYPLSMWRDRVDEYLEALAKELRALGGFLGGKKPTTVYIGGGTPTTLSPRQLDRLLGCIEENFDLGGVREFTVEAGRPDSIDTEKLKELRRHGIGRISVNPQTMNPHTLELIGRKHTTEQVRDAFYTARECGFDNINMDLIAGLPDEGIDEVRRTLEETAKLAPDSLTVHSLAIKRAAGLHMLKDAYSGCRIENTDEIMALTREYAADMGLEPYYLYRQKNMAGNLENVGYARPGKECLYNILIMEERQSIWAAGANAQSKIVRKNPARVDRIENVKDVSDYIGRIGEMIDRKRRYMDAESDE